jgi:hypothetical protein
MKDYDSVKNASHMEDFLMLNLLKLKELAKNSVGHHDDNY